MGIDPARRREPGHLRQIGGVALQQPLRQPAGADDLLAVIDIMQESIERAHPLLDPARNLAPLSGSYDPGDGIERDQPFLARIVAVDIEGNAGAAKEPLRLDILASQPGRILGIVPFAKSGIGRPHPAAGIEHLVIDRGGIRRHGDSLQRPVLPDTAAIAKPPCCNCERKILLRQWLGRRARGAHIQIAPGAMQSIPGA